MRAILLNIPFLPVVRETIQKYAAPAMNQLYIITYLAIYFVQGTEKNIYLCTGKNKKGHGKCQPP